MYLKRAETGELGNQVTCDYFEVAWVVKTFMRGVALLKEARIIWTSDTLKVCGTLQGQLKEGFLVWCDQNVFFFVRPLALVHPDNDTIPTVKHSALSLMLCVWQQALLAFVKVDGKMGV